MRKVFLCLAAILTACARSPQPEFRPFTVDWRDNDGSPVDVSFVLEAPAGKDGFIRIADGHLVYPGGRRFRIWGVNLSFSGNAPDREHAPILAAHLARHGVNCVRVHHFDRAAPRGLIDDSEGNTRKLHPEMLDRFDYFVAESKRRGIYVNLNLNVSRQFLEGDGVKDAELTGYAKALTYFDPRLIELQKEYARQLLTHRNPYTGNEYRNEPAVAIVEMVNENSLIEYWARGRLRGKQTTPTRETWTDIPPSYERDLTRLYHGWLRRTAARAPLARLQPEEFASASPERFALESRFYMELERNFFETMSRYLKQELDVQSLLVGTSAHSGSLSPYPLLRSASKLDIVDGHTYWQHPRYVQDASGKRTGFTIENTPMVNDPLHSTVNTLSRNAIAGKPYTVSEVNHPWPSEYAAEGIPILAAYGAFHDWDGIFWYSFAHQPPQEWKPGPPGHFDIRQDPVKMAQLAAGALLFARPDVASAKQTIHRSYSASQVIESLRLPRTEAPYFTPGFPLSLPLEHAVRIASLDGDPTGAFPAPAQPPYRSDTGELVWRHSAARGLVTVDTARSQALIGFLKNNTAATRNLAASVANEFCAITLGSLDGKPISTSDRMLLTTGSRVGTTGMKWDEKRTTLVEQGSAPVVIETVAGEISLKQLEGAAEVRVQALDGAGKPLGAALRAQNRHGGWSFSVGRTATPWYFIQVARRGG